MGFFSDLLDVGKLLLPIAAPIIGGVLGGPAGAAAGAAIGGAIAGRRQRTATSAPGVTSVGRPTAVGGIRGTGGRVPVSRLPPVARQVSVPPKAFMPSFTGAVGCPTCPTGSADRRAAFGAIPPSRGFYRTGCRLPPDFGIGRGLTAARNSLAGRGGEFRRCGFG